MSDFISDITYKNKSTGQREENFFGSSFDTVIDFDSSSLANAVDSSTGRLQPGISLKDFYNDYINMTKSMLTYWASNDEPKNINTFIWLNTGDNRFNNTYGPLLSH